MSAYQPTKVSGEFPDAAVLMAITNQADPEILLTKRAEGLSSHGGDVAFPGGKKDPEDADLLSTALRETEEEVGLERERITVLGPLNQLISRNKVRVSPWVGVMEPQQVYQPNPHEVESIFHVPVSFFLDTPPAVVRRIELLGGEVLVPVYHYEDYKVWGLTAMIIVNFLQVVYGFDSSFSDQQIT